MTGRRWFWGIATICNALGIWKWYMAPGIEVFWLIVWALAFLITLEAFINNRNLTGEKNHGHRK